MKWEIKFQFASMNFDTFERFPNAVDRVPLSFGSLRLPSDHQTALEDFAKAVICERPPSRDATLRFAAAYFAARARSQSSQNPLKTITPAAAVTLRILHINDVYILDQLPALRTCLDALSEGMPRSNVLTTLGGDFLAPSLLSSIDHGRGMVSVMNAVPIKAICFGNHECDVPHAALLKRIGEFEGVWLNSNMRSLNEELPEGALPSHHALRLEGGRCEPEGVNRTLRSHTWGCVPRAVCTGRSR